MFDFIKKKIWWLLTASGFIAVAFAAQPVSIPTDNEINAFIFLQEEYFAAHGEFLQIHTDGTPVKGHKEPQAFNLKKLPANMSVVPFENANGWGFKGYIEYPEFYYYGVYDTDKSYIHWNEDKVITLPSATST